MAKIVCGSSDFANRGVMAIAVGLVKCLKGCAPDLKIDVFSSHPFKDKGLTKFGIGIRQHPWIGENHSLVALIHFAVSYVYDFLHCLTLRVAGKFNPRIKCSYDQYAVLIEFNNIICYEKAPLRLIKNFLLLLLTMMICRKPTVTLPATLGPFPNRLMRRLAMLVLNRIEILALRDEVSYEYARTLGLSKPQILLVGDPAFLLDSASEEEICQILQIEDIARNDKPLMGFSPRYYLRDPEFTPFGQPLSKHQERLKYVNAMAQLVDHLVEKFDAIVCLIPWVYEPDDREMHYRIYEQVRHKSAIKLLQGEYLADELKGVIGCCDIYISGNTHGAVASISMGIPTITIAYQDKVHRLIGGQLGQQEYIVDIRRLDSDEFVAKVKLKIDSLWANREKVKQQTEPRVKLAQQQVYFYGKLIKELIESKQRGLVA